MTNDKTAHNALGTFSKIGKTAWIDRAQEYVLGVQLQMIEKDRITRMNCSTSGWTFNNQHGMGSLDTPFRPHPKVRTPQPKLLLHHHL